MIYHLIYQYKIRIFAIEEWNSNLSIWLALFMCMWQHPPYVICSGLFSVTNKFHGKILCVHLLITNVIHWQPSGWWVKTEKGISSRKDIWVTVLHQRVLSCGSGDEPGRMSGFLPQFWRDFITSHLSNSLRSSPAVLCSTQKRGNFPFLLLLYIWYITAISLLHMLVTVDAKISSIRR